MNFLKIFSTFVGHFYPPGSGSTDPIESESNPIRIRMRNPGLEDGRPGDAVVGAGQLYRVVGVEGAALVGQLGLELGGEGEQGVVFDRRQPMLGGKREREIREICKT
jgi:hypothetical protein